MPMHLQLPLMHFLNIFFIRRWRGDSHGGVTPDRSLQGLPVSVVERLELRHDVHEVVRRILDIKNKELFGILKADCVNGPSHYTSFFS